MPVYMIRAGEHGPVKIGWSANPTLRLVKMQADNHELLTLMRLLDGGAETEAKIHRALSDLRLRGEWFAWSERMLGDFGVADFVVAQPQKVPRIPDSCTDNGLRLAIGAAGSRAALARLLGYRTHSAVLKWSVIPTDRLIDIEAATGIPREELRPDLFRKPAPLSTPADEVAG